MLVYTGCFFTGPALKVLSMELVPPNKVHREEAQPGDSVSIRVGHAVVFICANAVAVYAG